MFSVNGGKNQNYTHYATSKGITDRAFALKCIQKARVVQYGQQRHIMDEKNILAMMETNFILGLHKTFKSK